MNNVIFFFFQERQLMKRNGPQLPLKIQSDEPSNKIANKIELNKITNELPQKKKAPPPPPNVSSIEKNVQGTF